MLGDVGQEGPANCQTSDLGGEVSFFITAVGHIFTLKISDRVVGICPI